MVVQLVPALPTLSTLPTRPAYAFSYTFGKEEVCLFVCLLFHMLSPHYFRLPRCPRFPSFPRQVRSKPSLRPGIRLGLGGARFVCLFVISYVISILFQVAKLFTAAKPSADKPAKVSKPAKVAEVPKAKPSAAKARDAKHSAGRSSKVCSFVCYFICYLHIISGCQAFHL